MEEPKKHLKVLWLILMDRIHQIQGGSCTIILITKLPGVPGTHLIKLVRMKEYTNNSVPFFIRLKFPPIFCS